MNAIEITHLSKYYGSSRGVEDINLAVKEGEIFGFVGPNGAGKSTTIRVLLNLIFPTSGNARILNMDVVRETKKIKEVTGYVPSDAGLYDGMKTREFLAYCAGFYNIPEADKRIKELAGYFELELDAMTSGLSTGNRKKASIIQAFTHRPKLLILDEPTSGLDPLMQARFFELVRSENKKGSTIFLSSHILSEVQAFCSRVAVVRDGGVIAVEKINSLRKKQLKRVTFEYKGRIPDLKDPAIRQPEIGGNRVSFMYSGDINRLVRTLSKAKLSRLTIEEPQLDEVFMHYYKK
jgi:ABC-2 type transport system ATP-binding protein